MPPSTSIAASHSSPPSSASVSITDSHLPSTLSTLRTSILKHGKYVLTGALGCYYLELPKLIIEEVLGFDAKSGGWRWEVGKMSVSEGGKGKGREIFGWEDEMPGRRTMLAALSIHSITIAIFLYLVLYLPWVRGYIPDYSTWQGSRMLRLVVPILTTTIVFGYILFIISLDRGTGLGVLKSILASTALYTFTFGVLGLIPVPPSVRMKKREKERKKF